MRECRLPRRAALYFRCAWKGWFASLTIKRRLGVSNMLMLIVPVILIIVASVGVLAAFIGVYQDAFHRLASPESASFAKSNLSNFAQKYEGQAPAKRQRSLDILKLTLGITGFRFSFDIAGETVYSNFTDLDAQALQAMPFSPFDYQDHSLLFMGDKVVAVFERFTVDGKDALILAVNSERTQEDSGLESQAERFMSYYLGVVILLAVGVIALTNGVLTARVAKSLLTPLEQLSQGAKQIQQGNLDFELHYDRNDEFRRVFDDFDDMRIRLRNSVQSRLREDESQREFIAGISHDLRTPLTTIRGYAEGLRDGVAATPERQKKYLDMICRKSGEMEKLVERLFLLSKLETGHMPFRIVKTELCAWMATVLQAAKEEFAAKGVEIALLLPRQDVFVPLDGEQMRWVIMNLLENSAKYKVAECVHVRIVVSLPEGLDVVCITVADDGPGIPEASRQKIFDIFYRADASRTRPETGSGLGLAIVRRIVEGHGGKIEAHNQNGLTIQILLKKRLSSEKGGLPE